VVAICAGMLHVTTVPFSPDCNSVKPSKWGILLLLCMSYAGLSFHWRMSFPVCIDVATEFPGSMAGAQNTAAQLGSFLSSRLRLCCGNHRQLRPAIDLDGAGAWLRRSDAAQDRSDARACSRRLDRIFESLGGPRLDSNFCGSPVRDVGGSFRTSRRLRTDDEQAGGQPPNRRPTWSCLTI
jgi:hypothetical protein